MPTMSYLRQFADAGVAIIVVAALARSKDAKGRSSYTDGLSLASFRETSELEYGADDAFILAPADDAESDGATPSRVVLKHLKSRHGETRDIALAFDRKRQRFAPAEPAGPAPRADNGKLQAALRAMWNRPHRLTTTGGRMTSDAKPPARRKTSKRRSRLRFEILNAFVDTGMVGLSRAELAVWLILYRDTKRDGTARASLDDLARRAGIDRQTASRAVEPARTAGRCSRLSAGAV